MYNAPTALRRVAARTVTARAATRAKGYAQAMGDDPLSEGPFSLLPSESNALWNSDGDTAAIRERKRKHGAGGSIFRNNDSARHSSIRCHFHRLSVRSRLPLPSIGPSLHAHSVRLRL